MMGEPLWSLPGLELSSVRRSGALWRAQDKVEASAMGASMVTDMLNGVEGRAQVVKRTEEEEIGRRGRGEGEREEEMFIARRVFRDPPRPSHTSRLSLPALIDAAVYSYNRH